MGTITLGLSEIQAGIAGANGVMPGSMTKIGKTYRDSCKLNQATSDITEHFEEGKASPEVRKKTKKIPVLAFQLMDPDVATLIDLVGGALTDTTKWGFDGTEVVLPKAVRVKTEQGLYIDIPNGDIEAVINAEFSAKGIFLLDVTVTPLAVSSGKSIMAYIGLGLVVSPTALSFTSAADSTGKTITATSTGNVTYAAAPQDVEWMTVTKSAKVVTVKVLANANGESRTANVIIIADGLTAIVPVTQAGV